ncbi:MAG: bifunctional N(6)-L-threonylcarbamoyladenine synthase/serine/threonine protein kinase [Halobacteriaceae archaeon]
MRVLGLEGTAWAASAAVYDADDDSLAVESEPYRPSDGGIHPREAAEHMREHVPEVLERALDAADGPIDCVAFSRGPGLGPCLRIVASAARAFAATVDAPLVGVNHMVAHLEVGRHRAGFDDPLCLNASGANAHVLAYHGGRYRVLGETMDTGVGNALDKFARHVGWSHPGGPKIERRAAEGDYHELPYVVKGMDFSFAGLTSAAQAAVDDGVPVEDVCRGLEETVFGMLTEVAERGLALTGRDELVLGGGVGQNDRLRSMLAEMCAARDAAFYAPDAHLLRDNAGMIALLGAKMARAGDTVSVADSAVRPSFRPDEVPVTWRSSPDSAPAPSTGAGPVRGAEATVELGEETVTKRRPAKPYRHPALDDRLRRERTVQEARLLAEARRQGVPTPVVVDVDVPAYTLTVERVGTADLRDRPSPPAARAVGRHLAAIHQAGIVHGDPTVRNLRVAPGEDGEAPRRVYLIDFGLGYHSHHVEDHAVDCHVFQNSVAGTAPDPDPLLAAFEAGYRSAGDGAVVERAREVAGRGRYGGAPSTGEQPAGDGGD